jgi:hypothetical protein
LKLDPVIYESMQKEKVQIGDIIYIESSNGSVKRVGRSDAYATEYDLEAEEYGFYKKPLVIVFEGGHAMFAVTDDECNDGGSFLFLDKEYNTRPGFVEKLIYTR